MPSQEPIHLFVYGTLTDPERVAALTGKQFERVDATLNGFERVNSPQGTRSSSPEPRPSSAASFSSTSIRSVSSNLMPMKLRAIYIDARSSW